jgi:predicted ATPase/DNA-binding SARP family transcriptional activator
MCRFGVLGSIEVRADGRLLPLGGTRQVALLAFFLLHRGRRIGMEELVDAVWEEHEPDGSVKRVQVAVARLRRSLSALGDAGALTTVGSGYRLDARPEDIDAEVFARRIRDGRDALRDGRYAEALQHLDEALALWRDRPLADVSSMRFAQREIARLEELRLDAIEARIEAERALGRSAGAVGELEALVASHPAREGLTAQLMLALYESGRQADALAAYQRTRAYLDDELGLEPGPELRDLQARILRHDATLAPEPSAPAAEARVPRPPNATVGRDAEIAAIVSRLGDERCRLVTLTGPGGVGKTRIALEASRAAAPAFADGAQFISLADVRRAEDVAAAILRALGVVPLAGEGDESAVVRFLGAKELLLVLDNLEQIVAAAPLIARLLEATTGLSVLATSREPLRLRAEECHPIAPLASADAVALFCQRATARTPDFVLDADNEAAVAEISRRVDGLPLALELAAARCGLLSPREIADRLGGERGDLGSGPRDAPVRQRTLRETISWSYELLTDEEQTAFARFAVFAGGASVDAAEEVTGSSLEALDSLVAKSLLLRRGDARGSTRLQTLATTHAYARERLAAMPDLHAIHARHHRYFADIAHEHGTDQSLMRADRREHLARLDADSDNLDAALAWALRAGDGPRALELCGALGTYWAMRHRGARMVPLIDEALKLPSAEEYVEARIGALVARSWCSRHTDATATGAAVEAEALARDLENPLLLARALEARADVEADRARIDVALAFATEALCEARASGDEWQIATAWRVRARAARNATDRREQIERAAGALAAVGNLFDLGNLFVSAAYGALRDGSDALEFAERAMPVVRALDEPYLWMNVQANVALAALSTGDLAAAGAALRDALELSRRLVVRRIAAEMMAGLGVLAASDGDLLRAARLVGAAATHAESDPPDVVTPGILAPYLEDARARLGAEAWDSCVREGGAFGFEQAVAYALGDEG